MGPRNQKLALVSFFTIAIWACAQGSPASDSPRELSQGLSNDQRVFESAELHGGMFYLGENLPFGGGALVPGTHYFYSISSGGLEQSPLSAGPQIQTPVATTLDGALSIPAFPPSRVLHSGQIWLEPANSKQKISYESEFVRRDILAHDGVTILVSDQYSKFQEKSLKGFMKNSPEEFNAANPVKDWIHFSSFSANAKWLPGSGYIKMQGIHLGDTIYTDDCENSTTVSTTSAVIPIPCKTTTTLEKFFPITFSGGGDPYETDFAADGEIRIIQGLRTWVAKTPLPASVQTNPGYRVFFEMGDGIYEGRLEKDGAPLNNGQADGSAVRYQITLNAPAVKSIEKGLITGAVSPGSQAGSSAEVHKTIDLFGIGGHGVNGSLSPADLRHHYHIPENLTGEGQTVAIVDAAGSGDFTDDFNVFSKFYDLPQCNSTNPCLQHIDLSKGKAVSPDNDWGVEIVLDTQLVHAIAPRAKIILVTAASSSDDDLMSAINYAASLPGVTAVSMSFETAEFTPPAEDFSLSDFQSKQGVIFFASSGDSGNARIPPYPASSPYVTAVGGTRIHSLDWKSPDASETAWEFSGGGDCFYEDMPDWQFNFLGSKSAIDTGMRAIPDVAAVADGQHSAIGIYFKDSWQMAGGTSAATPIWAGISALLGEYLHIHGKSLPEMVKADPGGFNGLLYQTKQTNGRNKGFHDIISGSNNLTATPCPLCSAGTGYDHITGLGSPDVKNLFSNF